MEDCLPENFADDLIELESLLEEQYSMDIIQRLNQLYRIGIDYYVAQQPRKAMHFQKKMTSLLCDPKTLIVIEEPSKKSSLEKQQHRLKNSTLKIQGKIKDEMSKFNSFSDHYIKGIMQASQKGILKNKQLRAVDLNKQEKNLEQRIQLKKVRSQQKLQLKSPRKCRQSENKP